MSATMDKDILEALRDVARGNANSAPQRGDMCGPQWAHLAALIEAKYPKVELKPEAEPAPITKVTGKVDK